MIRVNGKKFAKNDREALDSIFSEDGVFAGFYRTNSGGILLMDMQENVFAFIVNRPREGFLPFVNFIVSAHRLENGRIWYSCGLSQRDAAMLGITPETRYSEEQDIARAAVESLNESMAA